MISFASVSMTVPLQKGHAAGRFTASGVRDGNMSRFAMEAPFNDARVPASDLYSCEQTVVSQRWRASETITTVVDEQT